VDGRQVSGPHPPLSTGSWRRSPACTPVCAPLKASLDAPQNISGGARSLPTAPSPRAALKAHKIRGAALDVFAQEPLPAENELWGLDNVLMSPHCADRTKVCACVHMCACVRVCERVYMCGGVRACMGMEGGKLR